MHSHPRVDILSPLVFLIQPLGYLHKKMCIFLGEILHDYLFPTVKKGEECSNKRSIFNRFCFPQNTPERNYSNEQRMRLPLGTMSYHSRCPLKTEAKNQRLCHRARSTSQRKGIQAEKHIFLASCKVKTYILP